MFAYELREVSSSMFTKHAYFPLQEEIPIFEA
jgi:hypothetical protein